MAKAFVGITDFEWYEQLSAMRDLPEVNFWQPSGRVRFKALSPGELFLFKLHSPNNYIVGGGFFSTSSLLPVSIAWETFGLSNGVRSLETMRERIAKYRRAPARPSDDYTIGNIILEQPFFLHRDSWLPVPEGFPRNVVQGKTYDLQISPGKELWAALQLAVSTQSLASTQRIVADGTVQRMFSEPLLTRRRLGQGGFRVLVTDTYSRRCAVTGEHTLLVLEAAHIKPVALGGQHRVSNGLLLRSDVHTLFDRGYVTITPDFKFQVSRRLEKDWSNGKVYYALAGSPIHVPGDAACRPDSRALEWHADEVFLK
jgi:putative restriction endonuclease